MTDPQKRWENQRDADCSEYKFEEKMEEEINEDLIGRRGREER